MKGEWQVGAKVMFEQEDNRIWVKPSPNFYCGESKIEGSTDGITFDLRSYNTNSENPGCQDSEDYLGRLSSDCNFAEGTITMHHPGRKDEEIPFKWYRNLLIQIIKPDTTKELVITAEPNMPEINVEAIHKQPDPLAYLSSKDALDTRAPAYTWHVAIAHDMIPGRVSFKTYMDDVSTDSPTYKPDFNRLKYLDKNTNKMTIVEGGVMGGELTLGVRYYNTIKDQRKYTIKGTNPGRVAIDQVLTDTVTRQIACQESRYLQFHAAREGGIGFPEVGQLPNGTRKGGVGIMQLYEPLPTPQQAWNWKKNLEGGMTKFNDSLKDAKNAHIHEQTRLNKERKNIGLPSCPAGIPTKLTSDQIIRETIRRYNCGVEYRWEPRDTPDCAGHWIVYHSCNTDDGADMGYIDKVLSCKL